MTTVCILQASPHEYKNIVAYCIMKNACFKITPGGNVGYMVRFLCGLSQQDKPIVTWKEKSHILAYL